MRKYEVLIDGMHACFIASSSKRDALERIQSSRTQQVGAIWECIKQFSPELPVNLLDLGRI